MKADKYVSGEKEAQAQEEEEEDRKEAQGCFGTGLWTQHHLWAPLPNPGSRVSRAEATPEQG